MLLNSEKRYPAVPDEPVDPAGNPAPPDHWDVVPEIVVQRPPLFGGFQDAFQMAPFEHPHVLWHQDGHWRIDPYGVGMRNDPHRDYARTTFLVVDGPLVGDLVPGHEYLLQHQSHDGPGRCGIALVSR